MAVETKHTAPSQVVLLTGAAQGIGRATARALARLGFRLGLVDRDREPLRSVEGELSARGSSVHSEVADVRDGDALRAAVALPIIAPTPNNTSSSL